MTRKQNRPVPRHPLAFGMTKWGPLPGTIDAWIFWGGPGDPLNFCPSDPDKPGGSTQFQEIQHAAANGTFQTVAEAEAAVNRFYAAYLAAEQAEKEREEKASGEAE